MQPSLPDVNSVAAAVPCWRVLGLCDAIGCKCAWRGWLVVGHGLESSVDDFGNHGLWMVGKGIVES